MVADMTSVRAPGKDDSSRHPYGPRAVGVLVPQVTKPAFQKQPAATAQLIADWPAIVGPALAATTVPRRFAAGTLTIACAGPLALELQHLVGVLIERINQCVGRPLVTRLRFVQEPVAAAPSIPAPKPRLEPVLIDGMPDGPLRDALAALGAWVKRYPA